MSRVLAVSLVCVLAFSANANAQTRTNCTADDALSTAASSLVLEPRDLAPLAIARALRLAGSDAPTAHALRINAESQARISTWLAELSRIADAPLVCGEAANEDTRMLLVTARAGTLEVQPGDGRQFRFAVAPNFHDPRVVALDAHGASHTLTIASHRVVVPLELGTPVMIQLVATGPNGPRPVAERALGEWRDLHVEAGLDLTIRLRLAAFREASNVGELRGNRLLTEVATDHANAVCRAGLAAHTLADGRDPEERLRAAGVVARVVGETVARAETENAAFDSLISSPSHNAALQDARFTDVGIGNVADRSGHRCVVIMLAAWPRIVPAQ